MICPSWSAARKSREDEHENSFMKCFEFFSGRWGTISLPAFLFSCFISKQLNGTEVLVKSSNKMRKNEKLYCRGLRIKGIQGGFRHIHHLCDLCKAFPAVNTTFFLNFERLLTSNHPHFCNESSKKEIRVFIFIYAVPSLRLASGIQSRV